MPTGLGASAGNAQVSLTWSATSGATSYHLKRATITGGPYTQIGSPTSPSYVDGMVTNGTAYYYVVSAVDSAGESANSSQVSASPAAPVASSVTITVDPTNAKPISKFIYGANIFPGNATPLASVTIDRLGGNRWTAYNWQTNYSNAGSDYYYQNDTFLSSSTTPLAAITAPFAMDRTNNIAGLMTVPIQGYVAADAAGPVQLTNPIQTSRFKTMVYTKGAPFTTAPLNSNPSVYLDEMVWAMDQHYSGLHVFTSTAALPIFIELDNEPDLWSSTHKEIQTSAEIGYDAFFAKTTAAAQAIKRQFPQATIYGPAVSGFMPLYSWYGTYSVPSADQNDWLIDGYIAAVKAAEAAFGAPLVDVISFHWYSQINDPVTGGMIAGTNGASLTDAQMQAIVQSPRSLWDPTFVENSWIQQAAWDLNGAGKPDAIQLLPRMLGKIAAANVSKGLAITEYFNGGNNNIAGLVAQADNLGIFGQYGLQSAFIWPLNEAPYPLAAFTCFRNFDGAGSNFGDTSVFASSSNTANVAAYVSTDSTRIGRVVMVLVNRSNTAQSTTVSGQQMSGTAHLYQITAASAATQGTTIKPVPIGSQTASGTSITLTLPAYSVTTVDVF